MKLLPRRLEASQPGKQRRSDVRPKSFQVRLQEAKEDLDGVGRVGDLKTTLVKGFIGKSEPESHLRGEEIKRAEA